jgi:electron transfer flavoprotein alpha subunit
MSVLCLVEPDAAGTVAGASLRALALARGLAAAELAAAELAAAEADGQVVPSGLPAPGQLAAVMFGAVDQLPLDALGGAGVTDVYAVAPDHLDGYAPRAWASVLAGLTAQVSANQASANQAGANVVVAAATERGSEVMAWLGATTGKPVAANCLSARPMADGTYQLVRQRWAGLLFEDAVLDASPALLTVATDAPEDVPVAAAGPSPQPPVIHVHRPELTDADLVVRAAETADQGGGVSLATARVVVGGGRGVGGPEGFAPLEELASLLGGVVGVSRVVTSQGWRPHAQQVGQTGTKITPELYLACGISGAIQHMAGCGSAKNIVAINTDPSAPIMSRADYAVIGDLAEIIPALVAAIKERG